MKFICFVAFAVGPVMLEAGTYTYTPIIFPDSLQTWALDINSAGTVLVSALTACV